MVFYHLGVSISMHYVCLLFLYLFQSSVLIAKVFVKEKFLNIFLSSSYYQVPTYWKEVKATDTASQRTRTTCFYFEDLDKCNFGNQIAVFASCRVQIHTFKNKTKQKENTLYWPVLFKITSSQDVYKISFEGVCLLRVETVSKSTFNTP